MKQKTKDDCKWYEWRSGNYPSSMGARCNHKSNNTFFTRSDGTLTPNCQECKIYNKHLEKIKEVKVSELLVYAWVCHHCGKANRERKDPKGLPAVYCARCGSFYKPVIGLIGAPCFDRDEGQE